MSPQDSASATAKIGIVYEMKPEPLDPNQTQWVDAGAVRFGLEYRVVDPARLAEAYAGNAKDLAELEAHSPEGGFHGAGISIHVVGAEDGHEYLRFDAFPDDPHYHYVRPEGGHNHWIPFDPIAGGDILEFALRSLRERLGPMLCEAGGERVAALLRAEEQGPAIDEVERLAYEARERA